LALTRTPDSIRLGVIISWGHISRGGIARTSAPKPMPRYVLVGRSGCPYRWGKWFLCRWEGSRDPCVTD